MHHRYAIADLPPEIAGAEMAAARQLLERSATVTEHVFSTIPHEQSQDVRAASVLTGGMSSLIEAWVKDTATETPISPAAAYTALCRAIAAAVASLAANMNPFLAAAFQESLIEAIDQAFDDFRRQDAFAPMPAA